MYKGQSETLRALERLLPDIDIKHEYGLEYNTRRMRADFYFVINTTQYIIEYNGPQHYTPICFDNNMDEQTAELAFMEQQARDNDLKEYCQKNDTILIEIDSRKIPSSKIEDFLKIMISNHVPNNIPIIEHSYGFENIAIKQKKNICSSRLDVNIKSEIIKGVIVDIPLIASNMSTVIDADFYIKLANLGAFGILHRAMNNDLLIHEINKITKNCTWVAASVGIDNNTIDFAKEMIIAGCNIITIDIAHGYSDRILEMGRNIKKISKDIKIIIGNTTNVEILQECDDFADAVKVGIAQGLACETKNTAGCTEKQFSAVLKFKQLATKLGMPIISDGGIREPADFTKSIAAGANSVMAGSIFASCPESAAEIVIQNNKQYKLYAGMASRYVQDKWKGGLKAGTCPEGGIRYLDLGEPVDKLLERYAGALRSGITYAGAKDIKTFQRTAEFVILK